MPDPEDQKRIFVSHATADKVLADKVVDLLQTGLSIRHTELFCSSGPGTGVPSGKDFKPYIENELQKTNFAIALITPSYFESAFCVCELGAIWVLKTNFFPLLVPPMSYTDLKAVSTGMLAEKIDSAESLDNLHQALVSAGWGIGNTARWNLKKDQFLEDFKTVVIAPATNVTAKHFGDLESKYNESKELLKEQSTEITELKKQIIELEKVRPAAAVQKLQKEFSGEDPFMVLLDEYKKLSREFPRIVRDTLYKEYCGRSAWTPNMQDDPDAWDNAVSAEERKLLCINGDEEQGFEICCDDDHPQIEKAKEKLKEITEFARSQAAKSAFLQSFRDNHKYKFDLKNSDFWSDYLRH